MRAPAGLLVTLSFGLLTGGQDPEFTLEVDVPVVTVDVSVTTRDGEPVPDLGVGAFRLFDDGLEQPILYFGAARAPYHIYLLLDASDSTTDQRELMAEVSAGLMQTLASGDHLAIGVFSDDVETLVGWDEGPEQLAARLEEWSAGSGGEGTAFYRSLTRVLDREFRAVPRRRALLVLTDGRDRDLYRMLQQEGRLPGPDDDPAFSRAEAAVSGAGIPVYIVAMNTDLNLSAGAEGNEYRSLERLYPESGIAHRYLGEVRARMERLSGVSGGRVSLPERSPDVAPLLEAISKELGSAYSLGWASPETGPGERTISVSIPGTDYQVHLSRQAYTP